MSNYDKLWLAVAVAAIWTLLYVLALIARSRRRLRRRRRDSNHDLPPERKGN
jgi:hypothetical protein